MLYRAQGNNNRWEGKTPVKQEETPEQNPALLKGSSLLEV